MRSFHMSGEKMKLPFSISKALMRKKRWDMKSLEKPVLWLRITDSTMFGSTLAASIRQAVRSSLKRSTLCTAGTKNPKCATHILPTCRQAELGPNSQRADGLKEDGLFRSLLLLQR